MRKVVLVEAGVVWVCVALFLEQTVAVEPFLGSTRSALGERGFWLAVALIDFGGKPSYLFDCDQSVNHAVCNW